MSAEYNTNVIKAEAHRLGFDFVGFSKADFLDEEAPRLEQWLKNNFHGTMEYMQRNFDKRLDPRLLVPGSKTVVSLMLNYYPQSTLANDDNKLLISKYAYGKDYHLVIKEKMFELMHHIQEKVGKVDGRVFVDSAPVLDRAWAKKSGLGWIGKNGNLINKKHGSFFFIAELIIDLPCVYDHPTTDHCGSCTRCIDACPTQAIVSNNIVDGSKCISYFTIELKDQIPDQQKGKMKGWVFGCDICQDVCPWNRFSKPTNIDAFKQINSNLSMKKSEWLEITEEVFKEKFNNSPLLRTGIKGMQRNIKFLEV